MRCLLEILSISAFFLIACAAPRDSGWIPVPLVCAECEARFYESSIRHPLVTIRQEVVESRGPNGYSRTEFFDFSYGGTTLQASVSDEEPGRANLVRRTTSGRKEVLSHADMETLIFEQAVEFLRSRGIEKFDFQVHGTPPLQLSHRLPLSPRAG